MSFNLTILLLSIFGCVFVFVYASICIEDKSFVSPVEKDTLVKGLLVSTLSVGSVTLVVCLFNIYIKYFH